MLKKSIYCFGVFVSMLLVTYTGNVTAQDTATQIEKNVDQMVTDIYERETNIESVKTRIEELNRDIAAAQESIALLEKQVVTRKEVARQRLIDLQLHSHIEDMLFVLLMSQNISELIERWMMLAQLQGAMSEQIEAAHQTTEQLRNTIALKEAQQKELQEKQTTLVKDTSTLVEKKEVLTEYITENRETLDKIARENLNKQEALDKERDRQKATEIKKDEQSIAASRPKEQETSKVSSVTTQKMETTTVTTTVTQTKAVVESKAATTPPTSSAKEFEVEATAYSYTEPGLTPFTYTGHDLRINPQVIAVDPRVIPLGSLVHVHGYGTYLAADTGGAIKGFKIDVHMNTVPEALQFGRRRVKITILE